MATYEGCKTVNLPAGADLNDAVYEALKLNAAGQVIKAVAAGDIIVGFLAMNPGRTTAVGDEVAVALVGGGGVGLAKASAAVPVGHVVVGAAAGRVVGKAAPADDEFGAGVALEAASAAGAVFRVLFQAITKPNGS